MSEYIDKYLVGKSITEADKKFVNTYISSHVKEEDGVVKNYLSGVQLTTNGLIKALVDFVLQFGLGSHTVGFTKYKVPPGRMVQLFDRARYLILKLDKEVYYQIID